MTRDSREGFVLLTVLWVIAGAALLSAAAAIAAGESATASSNRVIATRAFWEAHGCAEHARSIIDRSLDVGDESDAIRSWRTLDRVLTRELSGLDCDVLVEAAGTRLGVGDATDDQLRRLFQAMGRRDADALVDALVDWRDADDVPRPLGAEATWYAAAGRLSPRNGALPDERELRLVRGFESADFDSVLTIGGARLSINSAPLPVLASVPGFSDELLQRLAEQRATGRPIGDVLALAPRLSPPAARELFANYPDIARLTTVDPDAWIVTARGHAGRPETMATVELRLVRVARRAGVMQRRSW